MSSGTVWSWLSTAWILWVCWKTAPSVSPSGILPVLLPKGARVVQLLQRWVEDTEQKAGYLLTKTPLMAKREFFKISGH